ncbi:hypothetical protein ACFLZK_00445 [Patescibacteria group bacterium]
MKKLFYKLTLLFILSILITPLVYAKYANVEGNDGQTRPAARKEIIQDKKDEIQAKNDDRIKQRCENTANRIATKIARFQANKASHVEKYTTLKAKLEEIVTSLADKGIDTSDLEEHIAILDEMVLEYAQDYVDFIAALEDVENEACGEGNGFKDDMKAIRDMFKSLLEKRLAIRKYYVEVIRLDIKGIREQTREKAKEMKKEKMGDQDGSADEVEVMEENSESEE